MTCPLRSSFEVNTVCLKCAYSLTQTFLKNPENIMDAEHINQIGNQIADLTARTAELRGYL